MGAKSAGKNGGAVQALILVAVVLLTGYLVGAASVDALTSWWWTTVGGL